MMPAGLWTRGETHKLKTQNSKLFQETRMCDFAADAEAAEQLLVGRVLTVKRVKQLNANDYFYQMFKDNPEMLKIYLEH